MLKNHMSFYAKFRISKKKKQRWISSLFYSTLNLVTALCIIYKMRLFKLHVFGFNNKSSWIDYKKNKRQIQKNPNMNPFRRYGWFFAASWAISSIVTNVCVKGNRQIVELYTYVVWNIKFIYIYISASLIDKLWEISRQLCQQCILLQAQRHHLELLFESIIV